MGKVFHHINKNDYTVYGYVQSRLKLFETALIWTSTCWLPLKSIVSKILKCFHPKKINLFSSEEMNFTKKIKEYGHTLFRLPF